MTRDDVIRWAREADQGHAGMECEQFGGGFVSVSTLDRFAALVAAAEREACAQVCDQQAGEPECPERAAYCADAIRARGSQ